MVLLFPTQPRSRGKEPKQAMTSLGNSDLGCSLSHSLGYYTECFSTLYDGYLKGSCSVGMYCSDLRNNNHKVSFSIVTRILEALH